MNKFFSILSLLLLASCVTCHEKSTLLPSGNQSAPSIPASIDNVEIFRVDDSLIRIIEHDMELGSETVNIRPSRYFNLLIV